jgi:hypothetical protein
MNGVEVRLNASPVEALRDAFSWPVIGQFSYGNFWNRLAAARWAIQVTRFESGLR